MDDHATAVVNKVSLCRGDINMQRQSIRNCGRWVVKGTDAFGQIHCGLTNAEAVRLSLAKMWSGYTCGRGNLKTSVSL